MFLDIHIYKHIYTYKYTDICLHAVGCTVVALGGGARWRQRCGCGRGRVGDTAEGGVVLCYETHSVNLMCVCVCGRERVCMYVRIRQRERERERECSCEREGGRIRKGR